jgi:hypothetical protein
MRDIDSFLTNVFPDTGTDDLNLEYVLKNLPVYYWYIYYILLSALTVTILSKNINYLSIFMLILNIETWILLRSNWEFSSWMDNVYDYGGMFALLIVLGFFLVIFWTLLEVLQFLRVCKINKKYTEFLYLIRKFGIIYTLILSTVHFGPIIGQLSSLTK